MADSSAPSHQPQGTTDANPLAEALARVDALTEPLRLKGLSRPVAAFAVDR